MKRTALAVAVYASLMQQASEANGGTAAAPTIPASPIPGTVFSKEKYGFKKDELGNKRPTVELLIPTIGDVSVLSEKMKADPKVAALVLELVNKEISSNAREQVNNEQNPVNKQEELQLDKLTLEHIANLPPAERKGGGISKETWQEFFKDYVEVMVAATGKKKEQVENAAKLFVARLQPVKTQKKILEFLGTQLAQWFTTSQAQEEFAEVYEFLDGKIKEFMSKDEAALLANL